MQKTTRPKPKAKRTSAAEVEKRVDEIMKLQSAGLTRRDILQYASEKTTWGVTERTIDTYIARAGENFALEAGFERNREIGKAKRRYEMLFAASVKVMDYQRAIQAQSRLDVLLGLPASPAPQTVRIEGINNEQLKMLVDMAKSKNKDIGAIINAVMQVMDEYVN